MNSYTEQLVKKHARQGVFIDTNLLLLWIVGGTDPRRISRFKRTDKFVPEDFETLDDFLGKFQKYLTTPNVLTEVSNLAKDLDGEAGKSLALVFSCAIDVFEESYVASSSITDVDELSRFGLTDCGIMQVVGGNYLLLTDDFRLSQRVTASGGDAVNFNHLRRANWR